MRGRIYTAGTKPDTAPHDEIGTPAKDIERCTCGVRFRKGESHQCGHVGEWVSWDRYQARQEVTA